MYLYVKRNSFGLRFAADGSVLRAWVYSLASPVTIPATSQAGQVGLRYGGGRRGSLTPSVRRLRTNKLFDS
jgi:hypothetical protein